MVNRNSNGHILNVTGPNAVILDNLAKHLHFTYDYEPLKKFYIASNSLKHKLKIDSSITMTLYQKTLKI